MTKFANRAKMSVSSTGTGNVTLNAAETGYQTFVIGYSSDAVYQYSTSG